MKTATEAMGKLPRLELRGCETGYIVTEAATRIFCEDECRPKCHTWAFTTKAEAIAFIRKQIDGKDG